MNSNHRFLDLLRKSNFVQTLIAITDPIYIKHIEIFEKNPGLKNFEEYGTQMEKHLKSIRGIVGLLQFYFDDLDKVNLFLAIDKSKLKLLYGTSLHMSDYYQYHYDNFVIRITTSLDLCAKLGWLVYNFGGKIRNINAHNFIEKAKDTEASKQLKAFLELLKHIKIQRNAKVHIGQINQSAFDFVPFWNDSEGPDESNENPLIDYSNEQIKRVIQDIEYMVSEAEEYTIKFFETLKERLIEYVDQ
jgi:hypothetical protein